MLSTDYAMLHFQEKFEAMKTERREELKKVSK